MPGNALGAHTVWFCSMKVAIWQVCSRQRQRRIVPPGSRPRARRSPPPPYDRGLVRSPHTQGNQQCDLKTIYRAPWPLGSEPRSSDGSSPNRRVNHDDQVRQGSSRKGETTPDALEDGGGRSPLNIKDLALYPQPPANTRPPTLNSEEAEFSVNKGPLP